MPISVVELYRDILPKTNCGDCGEAACMAFATLVITEKFPIEKCPHLEKETLVKLKETLEEQYETGKYLKKDNAEEAVAWAKERASSMDIKDLPARIGGELIGEGEDLSLKLPYFNGAVIVKKDGVTDESGKDLTRYEQVFIFNHVAQGGSSEPTGHWRGFQEFPNTVSKIKSMTDHVEKPIEKKFIKNVKELQKRGETLGGRDITGEVDTSDLSLEFSPLPKVPLRLIFRDGISEEGIDANAKLLFDEKITEHLDIESIMFLSERLRELLCED